MTSIEFFCPACGETDASFLGEKNSVGLLRCHSCSTVSMQSSPSARPNVFDYQGYYSSARFEDDPAALRSLESLIRSFRHYKSTGQLLDLGFGEGGLLRVAEKEGWSCFGSEISPDALSYGMDRGWVVSADPETDQRFQPGRFDVVTMIEFIEHAEDPRYFISLASKLLRPGGAVYLTTPNARSLNARLLGIGWSVFAPPEHATIWSPSGLTGVLRQTGFNIRVVRTDGLNPAEIMARYRRANRDGGELEGSAPPASRNEAAFALNAAMSSSPFRRALKKSINQALTALRIGDSLKILAEKAG